MLKILIVLAITVVVLVVVISSRPDEFRVMRSTTISAPPAVVFAQVNVARNWEKWSPWAKLDSAMRTTYEGPSSGVGSITRWSGNNQVGEGSSTIIESRLNELVRYRLEMRKPFKGTNLVEFTLKPEGEKTIVTWGMSGKNNFMSKAMSLVMNCEKMCGTQFEKGLAQLKSVVEG